MIAALFAFGLFLTFTGCGDDEPAPTPKSISVGDYSFLKRGNTFVYEYRDGDGGGVEEYSITIDTILRVSNNEGLPWSDSLVAYIPLKPEFLYFVISLPDSSLSLADDTYFPSFRKGLGIGEKWYSYRTHNDTYDSTRYRMIVSEDASIDKYDNCVHVETWDNSIKVADAYFHPKYGLVYQKEFDDDTIILKSTNF
jgi:hypothetical protein